MNIIRTVGLGVLASALITGAAAASPVQIGFERIEPSNGADNAASQLLATATDGYCGANQTLACALFTFEVISENPNPDASITQIMFSDLSSPLFVSDENVPSPKIMGSVGNVDFNVPANNENNQPPGANNAVPTFQVTEGLSANSQGSPKGVGYGESLTLGLVYATGKDFSDLVAALLPAAFDANAFKAFRIGLHVQSLTGGASDSFVSTPIPLPMGAWLALSAVGGLVVLRRRREQPAA